jgi:hypothetical protein
MSNTQKQIVIVCDQIKELLIEKNKAYGDSALNPIRIFAQSDTIEQLNVRIDDKLNRMQKGTEYPGDDTINDLIGYLILLRIAKGANLNTPEKAK